MYRKVLVKKIMRTVKEKGESSVNGDKCTMEKTSPRPCTVTIPPLKTCITGTTSKSLGISIVEDDAQAWVLRKRIVDEKVIGGVTEGTMLIGAIPGQMGEAAAEGTIISGAAVLWMAWSLLATAGAFVLRTVDMEMACGMTLKTMSRCIREGFWAQAGIMRCNSCRIGGRATLVKGESSVSRDVRRDVE